MDSRDSSGILEVDGLTVKFGSFVAVDGVSFSLVRGETLAIVGESGSGKTTIARTIAGLQKSAEGRVRLRGRVGMIFQDALGSLNPRQTVGEAISEVARHTGGGPVDLASLMRLVGLSESVLGRFPHEFSGGQCQRICIAREIAARPDLLICDEAVSALDISVRAGILKLLGDLKRKLGLSILFITHDLGVVRRFADRVLVMCGGRIVEEGLRDQILEAPRAEYTKRLLASVLRLT